MSLTMAVLATVVSLNGNWNLKGWPTPVRGSVRTLEEVPAAEISVPAKVPGCYELDLCAAGLLPNLFYANNQYAVRKYEGHQWLYMRTFTLGKVPEDEKAVLEFDGLDTLCDVFLNGKKVGEAADMFIPHAFDVTASVKEGENELAVLFRAPIVESQFKDIAPIGDANSSAELEGFRKPAHMIGWDILPRFVSAGIFRDVRLVVRKPERIHDWFCAQTAIDPEKRTASYLLDLRLEGSFRRLDSSVLVVTASRKGKTVVRRSQKVVHWAPRVGFTIDNADLWWPRGFGEPALYDVSVVWKDLESGRIFAEKSFKLGVRKIEFTLADYEVATKKPGEMLFTVNGRPCFIRGTNWVPVDALPCRARDRIVPTLELIREANCNMIRVWGGGLYEPELFWDWCDENGIMVWQDFCFACTQYAQNDTAFHELVRKETIEVVKRLRNHASLALYCGNNENDQVFVAGAWKNHGPNPNRDVISRRILPEVVREFDPTHPYLQSSPYVNEDILARRARSVEGHHYRQWWKGDFFTASHERFYSEIGCHGCPSADSIREMFSPECHQPFTSPKEKNRIWDVRYAPYDPQALYSFSNELLPAEPPVGVCDFNDQWVKRGVCVFEEKAKERSKYTGCRNHRMVLQMHMLFGEIPSDLETFALESQCAQAEGMKFIVEHCRSRKFAKKTGVIWWNMRDGWPIISDAVVEYGGRKKRAYDYIRRAQRDVLAMVDENGDVLVVNDLLRPVKGHVTLTDAETGKTLFDGDYACGENAVAKVGNVRFAGQGVAKIRYTVDGDAAAYDSHYLYGGPTQKYVGEKKIDFARYCRWMGLGR